jgi:hypothetical protein
MADVTVTPDTRLNANPSLQNALARNLQIAMGVATFGVYESGGVAMDIPSLNNVVACFIESVAGYTFVYVPSTKKVLEYKQTGASGALDVVASGVTTTAAAPFVAFGFV